MEGYMTRFSSSCFAFLLVTLLSLGGTDRSTCSAARVRTPTDTPAGNVFIRARCNATDYPRLCVATLSSYAPTIRTSAVQLADVALNVSISNARATAAMMSRMSTGSGRMSRKEAEAVRDCIDALGDSVEYLRQSLARMGQVRGKGEDMRLRINDAQTWVSTALTDESTCMDEFAASGADHAKIRGAATTKSGTTKRVIRSQVVKAAKLTSNALALIRALSST